MKTFEVRVVVRAYRSTRIEVEATDWEDAQAKADKSGADKFKLK